jgi:serine phosphatase RsbU (regulator of sigma subunit)
VGETQGWYYLTGEAETRAEFLPEQWRVLVADHDREIHALVKDELSNVRFQGRGIEILDAYSKQDALAILNNKPDVAVAFVDLFMQEDHEGLDLIRAIRTGLENSLLRIILRTAEEQTVSEQSIIIDYDINDFMDKSEFHGRKLAATVITGFRSYHDLRTITDLNGLLEQKVHDRTRALTDANLKLRSYISRLESDQAAGGRMQQKLLPEEEKRYGDARFSSSVYTSMYLSGDFLDYFEIDDNRVGFYIADVSGHGISSAFITVLLKNFVDTHLENYLNEGASLIYEPRKLVKKLNSEILRENFGKYLTIFYGVIDQRDNRISYTNCGQFPYPMIKTEGKITQLSDAGTPVGIFGSPEFVENTVEFPHNSSLLVVSDGILELLPEATVREKRDLISNIFQDEDGNLQAITDRLGLSRQYSFPDDITFLLVQRSE